jgi:HD-GYP domain-containing protein (c-di-GMP phosphodiesterase class II)
MVLGRSVYDIGGHLVLKEGDKLTTDSLGLLARSGTAEILIEDPRVADVLVGCLYSARVEAKAVQALRLLMTSIEGRAEGVTESELIGIYPQVNEMAKRLVPEIAGEPEVSGPLTLQGYDFIHAVKTTGVAMLLGRYAEMDRDELVELGMTAMLSNMGYAALPPGIIDEPQPLTDDEQAVLHSHPVEGAKLLINSGLSDLALRGIEQHHERWDGSGYPEGRKGDEISRYAQIIALADTYHALLSKRPHRPAFKPHEAVEFIVAFTGQLFEPEIAQLFARRMPQYPSGLGVKLNTGEIGIISDPNAGHIARPIVRICFADGEALGKPYDLDLSEAKTMNQVIIEVLL